MSRPSLPWVLSISKNKRSQKIRRTEIWKSIKEQKLFTIGKNKNQIRKEEKKMKKKYECEIDCANCAAQVQEAIGKIPGVQSVKLNFMMQKFTLEAEDERFEEILQEAIRIGKTIEPDFAVKGV